MATYWVDAASGDNADPGSEAQPWETVAFALTQVGNGDTIRLVNTGTATDWAGDTFSENTLDNITIESADADDPAEIAPGQWTLDAVDGWIFQDLFWKYTTDGS